MGNAEKTRPRFTSFVRLFGNSPSFSPLVTLLVTFIIFFLLVPSFDTWRTFSGIVNAVSISGIVALGVTMLMIAGEFDLSVGALIAMSGFIFGTISTGEDTLIVNTLSKLGLPVGGGKVPLAITFALLIPALQGLVK